MHYRRDWQSLLYLLALPLLVTWLWLFGFSWSAYLLVLFLSVGISAVHHKHSERDLARTYRFTTPGARGDSNHLLAYLLHPLQAIGVLYPLFFAWLKRRYQQECGVFWYCLAQYIMVLLLWLTLAVIDLQKFLVLVLIPQLHGLHWLLATNYLQHAHADGSGKGLNFARNFEGIVNTLLFTG